MPYVGREANSFTTVVDVTVSDDLTVTDDATIGGALAVTGNVLVGKTSANIATVGHEINGNGSYASHTRSGNTCLFLNRTTSDGDIAVFRKDGTTVGSIGTLGSRMSIGTGDVGLFFNDQTDQIQPINTSTNAPRDAAIDLGATDRRFKDAYLSGTVTSSKTQGGTAFYASTAGSYIQVNGSSSNAMGFGMTGGNSSPATAASTSLGFHHWNNSSWVNPVNITRDGIAFNGDTAEANALDDYEEGTWTPVPQTGSWTVNYARYTKVGRLVTCSFQVTATAGGTGNDITGMPFTALAGSGSGVVGYQNWDAAAWTILVQPSLVSMRKGPASQTLGNSTTAYGIFSYKAA